MQNEIINVYNYNCASLILDIAHRVEAYDKSMNNLYLRWTELKRVKDIISLLYFLGDKYANGVSPKIVSSQMEIDAKFLQYLHLKVGRSMCICRWCNIHRSKVVGSHHWQPCFNKTYTVNHRI